MATIIIPEHIRKAINKLDEAAQELIDWKEDEHLEFDCPDPDNNINLGALIDILDDIQLKVTETQEEQGWI